MSESALDRVVRAIGDQFEFERELGRGGMSIVYRARDRRLDRAVAIKVLPPELAHDPAVRTRFAREAHTAAQLSHPHVVPIFDVGDRDGIAYFVMSLVTGGNLAGLLAREPRPPTDMVRRILCEVAEALGYAHERGVIHRDVKPDNVLLDQETGRALVTDFGIARALEAGGRLTQTGVAVGTPTYMSPEQATGERGVDGRSDIYSLGVVAYQMLTGRVPFTAGNSMALLLKHVTETPIPLGDLRPDAPRAMREVIERAMAKSPDDRWPTAEAFREALLSDDLPGASWRWERRQPRRYSSPSPDLKGAGRAVRVPPPADGAAPARVEQPDSTSREALLREPEHLAVLTPEQRADLRLWHGRIPLMDRIRAARAYALVTTALSVTALIGMFGFMVEDADAWPVLFIGPIIPGYMARKLWHRIKSLKARGVGRRRLFLMPRAKWVLPPAAREPVNPTLPKLVAPELLDGPYGSTIRRAAADRAAILDMVKAMPKADRALLPDIIPTVDALLERVAHLARSIESLEDSIDPELGGELDRRQRALVREPASEERDRRLALVERQRATLEEMRRHRTALEQQLESAALALGGLRLDLIKVRSSGLPNVLAEVTTATQEARALSRDIGSLLEAVAEMKDN